MSISNFSIKGNSIKSTLFIDQSRGFGFFVDEPQQLGGQDLVSNPVEYILAGYAGCLNVVIKLVAKELNIDIEGLNISIKGYIDASKFLGLNEEDRAGFQSLNVDIDLKAKASQEKID
ncbi:OsmC family protein [Flavobacterium sp. CS20]|uniref:OsmC family protein n=1 Tax=Flavobacterium sp. CS20 TaxID=2775246 RepID=UPI001FFC8731|nr:OsmC family protein [Flavobacterium sp. CS20]